MLLQNIKSAISSKCCLKPASETLLDSIDGFIISAQIAIQVDIFKLSGACFRAEYQILFVRFCSSQTHVGGIIDVKGFFFYMSKMK